MKHLMQFTILAFFYKMFIILIFELNLNNHYAHNYAQQIFLIQYLTFNYFALSGGTR